jgi:lipid-binding SYLF domain-containing protein
MRTVMTGVLLSVCVLAANKEQSENTRRLEQAADVFSEIMATPDKAIPRNLLESAYCLVVVPSMKQGAFIVGAKYGVGYISCRETGRGRWSAPGTVRIEGGSFGFQIGGSETDLVMLVKNKRGADRLLSDEFTLGGQGELSAGPVGRSATAQTDAQLSAEILSWSRSHGLFGGVALTGATLRQDIDDNEAMYGKRLTNRQIVEGRVPPPSAARRLIALFNKYSWRVTS